MTDPQFDDLNASTLKEVYPRVVRDAFFKNSPILAYMRDRCMVPFGGGAFSQFTFMYQPLIGGAYGKGDNFTIDKRQILSGCVFDPKYYYTNISLYKEEIQVENKGPAAVFNLIDVYLKAGMNTISAIIAIDLMKHGQPTTSGITGNRPKALNGIIEALNNGTDPSWEGSVFTSYGNQLRGSNIGTALNSTPYFVGDAAGNGGIITYNTLEEQYQDACRGNEEPDLMCGNKAVFAFCKERLQTQQRFSQEKDPVWGASGFKFNSAMFLKDDYFPSKRFGVNDADLGNYLTSTFTSPASPTTASNIPGTTTINVEEPLLMLNTRSWMFRVTNDREFGFGFTGFKPAQDSTRVAGQILANVNLECTAPWLNKLIYGING